MRGLVEMGQQAVAKESARIAELPMSDPHGRSLPLGTTAPVQVGSPCQSGLSKQTGAKAPAGSAAARVEEQLVKGIEREVERNRDPRTPIEDLYDRIFGEGTDEERALNRSESRYRSMIRYADAVGYDLARDNLEYWFSKKGGTRRSPSEQMRSYAAIQKAERINRERFDQDWLRPASKPHQALMEVLNNLEEGTSIIVKRESKRDAKVVLGEPRWDREVKGAWLSDLFYGSGNSELSSSGYFKLTRRGNTIYVEGVVEHRWNDTYDWHKGLVAWIPVLGTLKDADAKKLEDAGRAKGFKMESVWTQRVTGTVQIVNGQFTNVRMTWSEFE